MRATHYFAVLTLLSSASLAFSLHSDLAQAEDVSVQQTRETGPAAATPRPFTSLAASAPGQSTQQEGLARNSPVHQVEQPDEVQLPDAGAMGATALAAALAKKWGLAVVAGVLALILLVRKVGGLVFPWIATGKGSVVLSVAAGTLAAVLEAMRGGNPSVGVIVVAAASGLWSWGHKLGLFNFLEPKPTESQSKVATENYRVPVEGGDRERS